MLDLVLAHRYLAGLEHQNVGRHQDRVAEQPHADPLVGVLVGIGHVVGHRRLVGVGAIHQSLGGDAGEDPGQLQDFRDVGLGVEDDVLDIQSQRQPGGGDFQPGTMHQCRVLTFDQGVIVGQEVERLHVPPPAGLDGGQDRADVVTEMRSAGGGDAGKGNFHDGREVLGSGLEEGGKQGQDEMANTVDDGH